MMRKADSDAPKLTENDKTVLRELIEHSDVPDSKIASEMGISPQAVFKIRNKLEKLGIIKGYIPIIDFKKIGIHIMTFLIIRLTPKVWKEHTDEMISERIAKIPYLIAAYRVSESEASHILLLGFRDTAQKEQFITRMQTKYADEMTITSVYAFSVDKVIVQNPIRSLNEILDKTDFSDYEIFSQKKDN